MLEGKKAGSSFAIKRIRSSLSSLRPNAVHRQALNREITNLRACDHPNIVKLHDVREDEEHVDLVQDLCQGGELFQRIATAGHYDESRAKPLMNQLFSAVRHCHSKSIVHRDLKPENFVFVAPLLSAAGSGSTDTTSCGSCTDTCRCRNCHARMLAKKAEQEQIKLIDFGSSCSVANIATSRLHGTIGSGYYMAPEVWQHGNDSTGYTAACDVWSMGVVMYVVLCGYPPFRRSQDALHCSVKFDTDAWVGVSESARDLVCRMLSVDPTQRPTIAEVLEDRWLMC